MTKSELIKAISEKAGLSKADTEKAFNALTDVIVETVAGGDEVVLIGVGTFSQVEKAARAGRNPQTGEAIEIAARKAPKFKAAKAFKDAVK